MAQETKSRKPANTAFKQQRLKAWQPILTPKTVLPTFFIVGIIFAPLGGVLLYASDTVSEIVIDYTDCHLGNGSYVTIPSSAYTISLGGTNSTPDFLPQYKVVPATSPLPGSVWGNNPNQIPFQLCQIQFTLPSTMKAPVFLYYRLTNFYQNHRRYVKSYDANQLKGTPISANDAKKSCSPLDYDHATNLPYFPCGLIANSQFNDTISDFSLVNVPGGTTASNITYAFSQTNIAWPTDKYKYGVNTYTFDQAVPPPNWALRYPNGSYSAEYPPPNLGTDEHFQVWMRTAGLPTFRKLWGRNDQQDMPAGTYVLAVELNFDVTKYGGTKAIVLSTTSFLGGKNPFLGIAYIAVGCVCLVLGILFTAKHFFKPRKLGDHTYLSWNQGQNNVRNE